MINGEPILRTEHLTRVFPVKNNKKLFVRAVTDVSMEIKDGEIYGLVGESGCGKSTLGRLLNGLIKPTSGRVYLFGEDISGQDRRKELDMRSHIQMVFQDCYSSMDPRQRIGEALEEVLKIHGIGNKDERMSAVLEILGRVGMRPEHLFRYPHEFSGGQRQRIAMAKVLLLKPKIIICDEPVSALDVSIQAQILNLLLELQQKEKCSYLFITHDMSVVRHISDRVGVMYLGHIVEEADTEEIFSNTRHPYTKALLASVPAIGEKKDPGVVLEGELPSPIHIPEGCVFCTRCPKADGLCRKEMPALKEISPGHKVACHRESAPAKQQ